MTFTTYIKFGEEISKDSLDMIAAFVGDECRGVANAIRYDSSTTRHIAFLMVYSNRIEGDTLTFKLYNNEKQEISQLFNHVPFQPNAIYGTPTAPLRNLVEGKLTAYNFFSPNMDNRNDTWVIEYLPLYLDFEVSIYNSIGERLYNKKKFYQNDWNGTYKGDDLPNGTYYYIVKSPNGQFVYQGAISLIR